MYNTRETSTQRKVCGDVSHFVLQDSRMARTIVDLVQLPQMAPVSRLASDGTITLLPFGLLGN